jgi:uncharacterized Zn finger protein
MQSFNHPSSNPQSTSHSANPCSVPVPFPVFCGLAVLRQIPPDRFQKAVNCLADGSLAVTITSQSDTVIQATARSSSGKDYSLSLAAAGASCSCPDFLFRHAVCKHGVALALAVLRLPQPPTEPAESPEPEQPVNLRLGKVRKHFRYPA